MLIFISNFRCWRLLRAAIFLLKLILSFKIFDLIFVLTTGGPGIVSTGIICAILNHNEFLLAFFFTSNPTRTLPIGVALFQGERLSSRGNGPLQTANTSILQNIAPTSWRFFPSQALI
jgi:ABC-type glycerol-3-phosphate transport system permease component